LYFWELLDLLVEPLVEVGLTRGAQKPRERCFAHSWKTDWHQEVFVDLIRLTQVGKEILVELFLEHP
jgi:hypothetical protein